MIVRAKTLILLVAVAVGMAGCGSGSSSETDAASEDGFDSPLADYLGVDTSFDPGANEEQQIRIDEATQACMAEQGFEWVPDPSESAIFEVGDQDGLEYGSEEWTKKWGFGITTQAFPQEAVGDDLLGMDDSMFVSEEDGYEDPNGKYVASLSAADQEAYDAALYGDEPDFEMDPETMTDEEIQAAMDDFSANYEPSGCLNSAGSELDSFVVFDKVYKELGPEMDKMYDQAANDSRILALEQETSQCVTDKGLNYTTMDDVYETFYAQIEEMQNEYWMSEGAFYDEMGDTADGEIPDISTPELSEENRAKLAELQSQEIELAVAVHDCGGGGDASMELFQEVYREYEERFIDENRAALDAIKSESNSEGSDS